jgi:hypothetical protein
MPQLIPEGGMYGKYYGRQSSAIFKVVINNKVVVGIHVKFVITGMSVTILYVEKLRNL